MNVQGSNYGINVYIRFSTTDSDGTINYYINVYTIDINKMQGTPYNYSNYTTQGAFFVLNNQENVERIERIELFQKGFNSYFEYKKEYNELVELKTKNNKTQEDEDRIKELENFIFKINSSLDLSDIFVKNLVVQGATRIPDEDLNNPNIYFTTLRGTYLTNSNNVLSIKAELKMNGKVINDDNLKIYWLKKNSRIKYTNKKYLLAAGEG
jgi:hypothetical protein